MPPWTVCVVSAEQKAKRSADNGLGLEFFLQCLRWLLLALLPHPRRGLWCLSEGTCSPRSHARCPWRQRHGFPGLRREASRLARLVSIFGLKTRPPAPCIMGRWTTSSVEKTQSPLPPGALPREERQEPSLCECVQRNFCSVYTE